MSSNWIFCTEEPDEETLTEKDKKISNLTIEKEELLSQLIELKIKHIALLTRVEELKIKHTALLARVEGQ